MRAYYSDTFNFPLPNDHRFPIQKYRQLRERVEASGLLAPDQLLIPDPATDDQLLLTHSPEYLSRLKSGTLSAREVRKIGFPWSQQLLERSRRSVGGTIAASRSALSHGMAINLAGGTHHAHRDHGAGYCVFNDVAVAAKVMQAEGKVQKALIIDCDVHQGDGTAAIFAKDATVFTFSIHAKKNYPFHKQRSDLDIELADATEDQPYLAALVEGLETAFDLADADFALYLAGADPYKHDALGRLALTKKGLAERDHAILESCAERKIPVAVVLSGGYAPELQDIVDVHFNTLRAALAWEGVYTAAFDSAP